jgi:beta-galactosidase
LISPDGISRRALLRAGVAGGAALASANAANAANEANEAEARANRPPAPAPARATAATYSFNQGWRFGGVYYSGAEQPEYHDRGFRHVTLPHTVTPLSWGDWIPSSWEGLWIYRKHFSGAKLMNGRVLLDFDGVMTNATVYLNGTELGQHLGGYLPWSVELTGSLVPGENVLAVVVDGRWLDQPPQGNAQGPASVDYLQPAGIYRDVTLRAVPDTYIADVFAKPTDVLTSPGLSIEATIKAASGGGRMQLLAELLDGSTTVAARAVNVRVGPGTTVASIALNRLSGIQLWSPSTPKLYTVRTTLSGANLAPHTVTHTTGFRQASFEVGGFYLNGQRLEIFGINRHQLYPYTGMAAPGRLQQRDAVLLKEVLNCNMVRCSHYPQSPHFLDACDRIGLMVWEEVPGWQYVGDANFYQAFLQDVHAMVTRDRNRPSVIVWGTRLNESASYPTLYAEARNLAYALDGSRQTTGAMSTQSTAGWGEDLFAYDDYHHSSGNAMLAPPVAGVPYLVSEAVGAVDGAPTYRWIDSSQTLGLQAQLHAQVHDIARSNPAYAGLLGWCGIDYASLVGGARVWANMRWPGVIDTFRVPKPGAAFYRSQVSPATTPVILPAFYWDFGPFSPFTGPGPSSLIATNCDRLEIYVGGTLLTTATPDTASYGSLAYPPVVVDLTVSTGTSLPELLVVGYVGQSQVAQLKMSADTTRDTLALTLDDASIAGDGTDATRVTFRALDAYGNQRPYVVGGVTLSLSGPAALVGQNPFDFETYGGVGGAFIRSLPGHSGLVTVTAAHATLGQASVELTVTPAKGKFL